MFIVGSFYFTPHLSDKEAVGCWIFIVASAFWLVVSMHDAAELSYHQGKLILIRPDIDGFGAFVQDYSRDTFVCDMNVMKSIS